MSTEEKRARVVRSPSEFYPETAVLDKAQVCKALGISERQLERLELPIVYLGERTPRYIWRQVLAALEEQAA